MPIAPIKDYEAYGIPGLEFLLTSPLNLAKFPITPKSGEVEMLMNLAKRLNKPEPTSGDILYQLLRDRVMNAQLAGRSQDVNNLLRTAAGEGTPDLMQVIRNLLGR